MRRLAAVGLAFVMAACGGSEGSGPECGNGAREMGEQCDDGNTVSGDGCSSTCRTEVVLPTCGNEVVEDGEECDDGNTDPGDGCDADCQLEPVCGDGTVDPGEQCDDGNTIGGDGCSSICTDEIAAVCGNGIREGTEECDDGNTVSGDGCSATCTDETVGPACGDGVIDPGEQCDDGNTMNGDGCDSACQLEPGVCGDGVLNAGEQCDDGNLSPGDGCDATCMLEGPICGNGTVDAGEQCDDGNTVNGDGCSATCRNEVCGDGVVQAGEQCDDGNLVDGDGCSAACLLEVMAGCGNGVLEAGEECDDGNTVSGDGCSATCTNEVAGSCTPDWELVCESVDSWSTTYTGATDAVDGYSCVAWDESGPEYTYTFVATSAGDVTVSLSGMAADLDVFVLTAGPAGECDPTACVAYGDVSATFASIPGVTYYIVVDGYLGASSVYSIDIDCGECGDGNVDPSEQCDDGNTTSGDGCSATCTLEGCGNGTTEPGEGCDDGNTTACDGCSATCQVEACGNFVVECGETCDDGNTTAGDGCDATCQFESALCTPDFDLTCGATDSYATTFTGSTDAVDFYACTSWDESGREYAYTFVAPADGDVTVTLSGMTVDLDVFVVSDAAGTCASDACVAYGNVTTTFAATAGSTYYIIVDGYFGAEGSYTIDLSCGGGTCGDGTVNAGEQCDDGGTIDGDGCSATCVLEYCGDAVVQVGLGEECDDGNATDGDGCSATCQDESAACLPDFTVACGTVDAWDTTFAGATDQVDSYSCVPWNESGPEYAYELTAVIDGDITATLSGLAPGVDLDVFVVADPGDGLCDPGSQCIDGGDTSVTWSAVAGGHYFVIVDGFLGDSGAYTLTLTCAATATCGDGVLDPGEECDDGNAIAGDGCSSCLIDGGTCTPDWNLSCGSTDAWSTTGAGSTDLVDAYGCETWNESGREYTYSFLAASSGTVNVTLTPEAGVDLDLFVLTDAGFGCVAGNCLASGDAAATFDAVAGTRYFIVVDGYLGDEGDYTIAVDCP